MQPLLTMLRQLATDLADPSIAYLFGAHYYDRTNHPRYRHFPAVFALRQGEVTNVEIGADFLAFDTDFLRYPELGESRYPGSWRDKFRVIVPLSQLYTLTLKVLIAEELAAERICYGPEDVVYYNAAVHKNCPTLAEMNQPYTAEPSAEDLAITKVLRAVASGLTDPHNHYMVNTTYFESPDGLVMLGGLYLHADTVWNLEVGNTEFTCEVLLDPHARREKSRVRVGYGQVWQVLHSDNPAFDAEEIEEASGVLYAADHVLRDFARQGPPA